MGGANTSGGRSFRWELVLDGDNMDSRATQGLLYLSEDYFTVSGGRLPIPVSAQ